MTNQRNYTVDILRGLAVIGMILIHVTAYYQADKLAWHLWNWTQFVVPLFIFCSSYLYFNKSHATEPLKLSQFVPYLKKRVSRLMLPYYYYLFFYTLLIYLAQKKFSIQSVIRSVTLTTPSNDLSWLVLLFVYFTVLLPIIDYLAVKRHLLFLVVVSSSFISSLYFLFLSSPVNFKFIMWLPWLVIVTSTWYIVRIEKKSPYIYATMLLATCLFVIILFFKISTHQSLSFYTNKYPPNLYYLSFGLATALLLSRIFQKDNLPSAIRAFIFFMSKYSYSLFFIHFLVIFTITEFGLLKYFHWSTLFIVVTGLSMIFQTLLNKKAYFFSMLKKAN